MIKIKADNNKLKSLINKEHWSEVQKHIAIVTGITTQVVDIQGNPITDYSIKNSFCELIMNDSNYGALCKKCKSRGGIEAFQNNKPYIHLCPFDLIEISVPIVMDNEYIGSIAGGQVALLVPEAGKHLEHLVEQRNELDFINKPNVKKLYQNISKMKCTDIMATARMLASLTNYIIKYSFELLTNDTSMNSDQEDNYLPEDFNLSDTNTVKEKGSFFTSIVPKKYAPTNCLLRPVFDYLFEHKDQNVSLTDAACLCHLSPSYFSRLFTKEIGINYSLFVNKLKIEWAKELLTETKLSIIQISNELGFNDSSYFIKLFKKYEGITPVSYRKKAYTLSPKSIH